MKPEAQEIELSTNSPSWSIRKLLPLFIASFAALYFELTIIRYLSTEIRVFAYFKNMALIASFFGIGFGMILGGPPKTIKRLFPLIAGALFLLITYATVLRLTHLPIPSSDYVMWGIQPIAPDGRWFIPWLILMFVIYLVVVPGILWLVVAFFSVLGGLVGECLAEFPPLQGYGVNLGGSFAGILVFTLLSILGLPPVVWVGFGLLTLVPFFLRQRWAVPIFVLVTCACAFSSQSQTYWSPYYRITVTALAPPPGWPRTAAYLIDVNHDYHQVILDLSKEFTAREPTAEPNHYGRPIYELPYRFAPNPGRVLIVGAGTGNDVASALRHGAAHVDAVEIDPFIVSLGRKFHPEHPYDSAKVTVYVDDARAFFKKADQKYDLIVFGYLDSHTLLSGLSSIRLDNYVYTLESFKEARKLLQKDGVLVLGFGTGDSFVSDRLFATLTSAFGTPPLAYYKKNEMAGVLFVEGRTADPTLDSDFPEISGELKARPAHAILATDQWPFLYLRSRTIPFAMWSVLALILYFAASAVQKQVPLKSLASRQGLHLFFLGAGFMLLETKGVTELSLLFGSTWIVNSVVIISFLGMGLLANTFVLFRPVSRIVAYVFLFLVLITSMFLPYSLFAGLPAIWRVVVPATLAGLPVFFSGLIFSRSFRDVISPSQALGINLLGAVVGGSLENLVMIGGTPILGILALLLYGLSAAFVPRSLPGQEKSSIESAARRSFADHSV
ncbi:MAG: hypothetical protein WCC26_04780 [Terracidiphilus sp.]